jgi:O-antigen ligase
VNSHAGRAARDVPAVPAGRTRLPQLRLRRAAPLRDAVSLRPARAWTADLALLAGLLMLTALGGRAFSKVGVPGTPIYVTEVALAAVAALALRRCGVAGAVMRVRTAVPLVPLLMLWLAGFVAAVRGLHAYGPTSVIRDVGLVEYSALVPLVAVVVDTRARVEALLRALLYASVAATLVFAFVFVLAPDSRLGPDQNPGSATALYMALFVFLIGARALHGLRPRLLEAIAAPVAVTLMILLESRSVWLALLTAAVALVLLAPRGRRLRAAALGGAVAVAALIAALVLDAPVAELRSDDAVPIPAVTANGAYEAADDGSPLIGGTVVRDAAEGVRARELRVREFLELPVLSRLAPGERYTVVFFVKPLEPRRTVGAVGDTAGSGWSAKIWSARPTVRWQRVARVLTATHERERLRVIVYTDRVRIDGIAVSEAPEAQASKRLPRSGGADTPAQRPAPHGSGLGREVTGAFDPLSSEGANVRWRLAFWRYLLGRTTHQPLFGAGFGTPASFHWRHKVYDTREGDPGDPLYVSPPHNSFINLLFRMGAVGALGLVALVGLAVRRVLRSLRSGLDDERRSELVGVAALFAFALVITSFNAALEGPFMGVFFWVLLALLLVIPRLVQQNPETS